MARRPAQPTTPPAATYGIKSLLNLESSCISSQHRTETFTILKCPKVATASGPIISAGCRSLSSTSNTSIVLPTRLFVRSQTKFERNVSELRRINANTSCFGDDFDIFNREPPACPWICEGSGCSALISDRRNVRAYVISPVSLGSRIVRVSSIVFVSLGSHTTTGVRP